MDALRLLIWGGGGHGKVVADLVRAAGHALAGFADADAAKRGTVVEPGGGVVVASDEELRERLARGEALPGGADAVVLAVGDNAARERCWRAAGGAAAPALAHPSAVLSPSAVLGPATVVFPRAAVNADARIGGAVIVNTGAIVEHDCVLGDAAHVSPGAVLGGGVRVGARSWVGAGAVVLPRVVIGDDVRVGAGAVVVGDVPDGAVVVGVPARPMTR